jgi:hypothetical protein
VFQGGAWIRIPRFGIYEARCQLAFLFQLMSLRSESSMRWMEQSEHENWWRLVSPFQRNELRCNQSSSKSVTDSNLHAGYYSRRDRRLRRRRPDSPKKACVQSSRFLHDLRRKTRICRSKLSMCSRNVRSIDPHSTQSGS